MGPEGARTACEMTSLSGAAGRSLDHARPDHGDRRLCPLVKTCRRLSVQAYSVRGESAACPARRPSALRGIAAVGGNSLNEVIGTP